MKSTPVYSKLKACESEGWHVEGNNVWAYGETFPLVDPLAIHFKAYRTNESHENRYKAMVRAFEILWPDRVATYNYWMERVFREHTNHSTEVFTLCGGGGIGKALRNDSLVRTPKGWTAIEHLKKGAQICTTDGRTQSVLGVYPQGLRNTYRVTFSDRTSIVADEQHLWTVYSAKQRDHCSGPQTITTEELKKNIKKGFSIPNHKAVKGTFKRFIVHPYLMGILLGDGSLNQSHVSATAGYEGTLDEIKKHWPSTRITWQPRDNCWAITFHGLRPHLPKVTSKTKFIPPEYLLANVEQRTALLQGLMDTDGYCSKDGTSQFTTVSPELARNVEDLARGLGLLVSTSSRIPSYRYKGEKKSGQRAYTLSLRRTHTTKKLQLFRIPYKRERCERTRKQYYHRRVVSVTAVGKEACTCIKVSHPNQLFFTNDYIVTHNTETMNLVACLFWLALPHKRAVIVASTELASLKNRIYGYILRSLKEATIKPDLIITNSPPPSIRCDPNDFMNGIFGVAAKKGDDDKTIESIKGRHPKNALLLILDEATDMPMGITTVIPNLKKSLEDRFQAVAIGNSKSWTDLHGAWSYPKKGIENIDPNVDFRWETTQPGGIALYFNPYDSPAIHEKDPRKKALLSKFLMNEEKLMKAEQDEGKESEGFWQFTMGFWRGESREKKIVTEAFLRDYNPMARAEFSGQTEQVVVAGLDPAFSQGGDKCILRLAILGQHMNGKMILDFRGQQLLFQIHLAAKSGKSIELQIAEQTIKILKTYNVPLNHLCIDSSGQGRGLATIIHLTSGTGLMPIQIFSTNVGKHIREEPGIMLTSAYEMWMQGRDFISHGQIFGLDPIANAQLHNRLVVENTAGKKTLEKKIDYKRRMAVATPQLSRSPDEADGAMLCLQSAILAHGFFPGQSKPVKSYPNLDSYRFQMALDQRRQVAVDRPFTLQANYGKGITSLLRKKAF